VYRLLGRPVALDDAFPVHHVTCFAPRVVPSVARRAVFLTPGKTLSRAARRV
jgi:hypothetical protein